MTELNQIVRAPINVVFDSFTTATRLCEWFCFDAQLEAAPQGRFYAYWRDPKFYAMGEYDSLQTNEHLGLHWTDLEGNDTRLELRFQDDGENTRVTARFERDIGPKLRELWERGLRALQSTLETGYHPEVLERPMLGVIVTGTINPENAATFELPVQHGIILGGTLPGLSAAGAGLRQNDVLTAVDEAPMTRLEDLTGLLGGHRAGDTVQTEFYRGGVKQRAAMELKARPLYDVPHSVAELAAQLEAMNAEVMLELDAVIADFRGDEADFKAAPNIWSANEVLAHLINTERDTQTMIASLENGNELEVFTSNLDARVSATARRYPSTEALVRALKETHAETVQLVRHLPEHFLARRAHVVRVQQNAEFDPHHTRRHLGQMRRAVAAARDASLAT